MMRRGPIIISLMKCSINKISAFLWILLLSITVKPVSADDTGLWLDAAFPKSAVETLGWQGKFVSNKVDADCALSLSVAGALSGPENSQKIRLVYVLVAPYPTSRDVVSLKMIESFWTGKAIPSLSQILVDAETGAVFSAVWGEPNRDQVITLPADEILETAWSREKTWAIIPFDKSDPRWKVLKVNNISPLDFDFDPETYPLTVTWQTESLKADKNCQIPQPAGNFDPNKLTTLTLTGTTAMVRRLAYAIEDQGADFVTRNIGPVLSRSDFTHISNEVSYYEDCPPGIPLRREARFCSLPSYSAVLKNVGADLIELTGNHIFDWGIEPFLFTLEQYREDNLKYYGGGKNAGEAQQPVFISHHGNRIAVVGCNSVGPESVFATDTQPGAARCDMDRLSAQVKELKEEGWMVVVTFQNFEYDDYTVPPVESHDFYAIAEAGPVIVSGSQAHVPQGFAFIGKTFVHFGLGNLLFDQISDIERDSCFDRHYFYDGRYIGNVTETIRQEETMQPRFLRSSERAPFLEKLFGVSDWTKVFK